MPRGLRPHTPERPSLPARGRRDLSLLGKGERNSSEGRRPVGLSKRTRASPLQPESDGRVRCRDLVGGVLLLLLSSCDRLTSSHPSGKAAPQVSGMQLKLMSIGIDKVERIRTAAFLPARHACAHQPLREERQLGGSNAECGVRILR